MRQIPTTELAFFSLDVDAGPCSGDVEHREVLLMMLI